MNLTKKKLIVATAVLFTVLGLANGQSVFDLNFQGLLADIQGHGIGSEPFDLSVQINDPGDRSPLFEFTSSTHTDEKGWFGFTISDISRFIMVDGMFSKSAVIRMEFRPNENTKWLRKGDDFMVTYTLAPSTDDTSPLKITRLEGTELMAVSDEHLIAFKDNHPFAYLTGAFLVTDETPVNPQSISDLKGWVAPEGDEDGTSRGVKGGFPTGGYHKKN